MHTARAWTAFAIAILAAGTFASGILWIAGRSSEMSRRSLWRTIATLWGCIIMAAAGMLVVRQLLGGAIIDYDPYSTSTPINISNMTTEQWGITASGVLWTSLWLYIAVRTVRRITHSNRQRAGIDNVSGS